MTDLTKYVLAAAMIVFAVLWWNGRDGDDRTAWEAEARAARKAAAEAVELANVDRQIADHALARARVAEATADSLASLPARTRIVERIRTDTVPAEAIPFTAPRDTLIAVLTLENTALRIALDERKIEVDHLRGANTLLEGTVKRLDAVLADRPKPRPSWMPMIVVGPAVGVDSSLRPFTGVAVTIGWKLSL